MALKDRISGLFSSKEKVTKEIETSASRLETIPLTGEDTKEYVIEMAKHIVKNSSLKVEKKGPHAYLTYSPKSNTQHLVRKSILGSNLSRPDTKRYTLVSDYDLAKVERFYEKEGLLRKFVVTATARAMRSEMTLADNPRYKPSKGTQDKSVQFKDAVKLVLKESNTTWLTLVQTTLKEIYSYGNSFIRKYRNTSGKLIRVLSDDPLFYRVAIDAKSHNVEKYMRQPRLRPRAWSEDTYNNMNSHLGLYPSLLSSDRMGRMYLQSLGYYGTTIGKVVGWEEIDVKDVVHFKYFVEKNAPIAMPPAMPSINDIEDMRILEENLVFLGWQYGHPILVATVNCENLSQEEADAEIERTRIAIDNMESIGFIVGSDRLKIDLKYPNGSNVPLDKFVHYLSQRITRDMDTAALLLGDGGSAGRQAGEAIEASSNDIIWMTCMLVAEKLEEEILRDIWIGLGGGHFEEMPLKVRLVEIDRTKYTAYVNQLTNLVNAYVIPPSRLLDRIGEKPLTAEEEKEIKDFMAAKAQSSSNYRSVNPSNQYGEQTPGSKVD
ncbi:MAG: hypothetical protein E6R13_10295 [Spirochaetes bacterium]|nr:MAG: hypothetical protein E6R13_10295 [Spirochaetota bacterium]